MPWFYYKHIIDDDAHLHTHHIPINTSKGLADKSKDDEVTANLLPEERHCKMQALILSRAFKCEWIYSTTRNLTNYMVSLAMPWLPN